MVDYAKYQLNLPLEKASLLATIHGICQVVGVLTVLPLSDYLGRKKTIIISNTIITGCLALILLVGESAADVVYCDRLPGRILWGHLSHLRCLRR